MALPGVMDPATGNVSVNPLDPTNPASGQSLVPQAPSPINLSQGVGLTGADHYNIQRLTRAQTYLSGALSSYPDLSTAVGLAPTDWQTMDSQIAALGGQPGYGAGVGQLMDTMMQGNTTQVPVADIGTIQQAMVKEGFLPPGTKITGVWDANSSAAYKAFESYNYNLAAQGQKPGGASATQFLSWLGDVLPSKVSQALAGTARFLFGGIAHTVTRQAIEAAHAPGTFLATLFNYNPGDNAPQRLANNQEVQQALAQHGLTGGVKGNLEDLTTVLSVLPLLRGAGVLSSGIADAATQAGERGLTTAAEGTISKGLVSSSVRTLVNKAALAESPTAVGDLLNSYAGRTFSLRALGEGFLNTADQVAAFKSTPLGLGITAGLNAATQTAVGERAVANIGSGVIAPNVKLGTQERSALGQAIDNTPALGQSWRIPGLEFLGNPIDLSAYVWAPTKALPIGGRPTIGDMANSLERITPTADTVPITRLTGLSRQDLVDAAGGEAYWEQGNRYFQLQAAVNRDAVLAAKNAGLLPGDAGWASAVRDRAMQIQTALKADPLKMEQAIASVQPIDLMHQFSYMFKDNPELLARRGQGQPVLSDWFGANNALRGTTAADAQVVPFTRGSAQWSAGNREALDAALEPFFGASNMPPLRDAEGNLITPVRPGGGSVPASSYAFAETMAGRLGQALDPNATIALRRIDNALGSAQQLGAVKTLWDRLGSVSRSIDQAVAEGADTVQLPRLAQVGDLQAAGFAPEQIEGFRNPRNLGLTGAELPAGAAQALAQNLTDRLTEIRQTMARYYDETGGMSDREISTHLGKLFLQAPRDVNLADATLQSDLAARGYQPVALPAGAITLNDVGAGTADGLANAGDVSPVKDWLGIGSNRPTDPEIQFMKIRSLTNELDQVAKTSGVAQNGEELLSQVRDAAREASDAKTDIKVPWGSRPTLYQTRDIVDLRQMTPGMLQRFGGFDAPTAWDIYGAIRRGAAFGFDISRPIATARGLMEALQYQGLPGIEDAIRTAVSARDRLPDFVQGPAGHILNLPENLVRARDFIQFTMNPQFTAARAFKTKILRAASDLPFDFRPGQRIADLADESGNAEEFMQRFADNYSNVMGNTRGQAYATLLDHPDFGVRNPGSGVFGWTNTHGEALDAWNLAQRTRAEAGIPFDQDLSAAQNQAIHSKLNGIYRYGNRSPLEKSINYVFFPFSFDLKVAKTLGGWMLQNPARILTTTLGLQAYNQANQNNAIGGFFDRYLPALEELNRLNVFAHGLGTQLSPIGGRNAAIYSLWKDADALYRQDPRLGAYVPIGASDENLPSVLGLFGNLVPMWRQMQTGNKALTSQLHSVTEGGADQWQVDNYYQTMGDLKRQVAMAMGDAGMKPSFSSLTDPFGNPNPKVNPNFFNQVQQAIGQVEAKYPAGAAFARAQTADQQTRAEALNEMFRVPVKTRAQASMLYFAAAYYDLQAQAQTTARANAAQSQAGAALYRQIAGDMRQGLIPATLPGELDAAQVATLRSLALELSQQAGADFDRYYNQMFKSELGPLHAYQQPPGAPGVPAGTQVRGVVYPGTPGQAA